MNISEALQSLGSTRNLLTDRNIKDLDEKGYAVFPRIIDPAWLQALRNSFEDLCEKEGHLAGIEVHQEDGTRRLSDLVNKGEVYDRVYTHPTILAAIAHVIGRDFKLSSLNARDAISGLGLQGLHTDWSADYNGTFHVCNSIWMLDDFTNENGSTRIVPGTHLGRRPGSVLQDSMITYPDEERILGPAGTVVVFNSHLWHGGTQNETTQPRRALHCYFTAREHPQQLDQLDRIRVQTQKRISRGAKYILDIGIE